MDQNDSENRIDWIVKVIESSFPNGVTLDELFYKFDASAEDIQRLEMRKQILVIDKEPKKPKRFYYVPHEVDIKIDPDIKELWFKVGSILNHRDSPVNRALEQEQHRIEVEKAKAINSNDERPRKQRRSRKRLTNTHLQSDPKFEFLFK